MSEVRESGSDGPDNNVVPFKKKDRAPEVTAKNVSMDVESVTFQCPCSPPRTLGNGERCPDCGSMFSMGTA